MATEENTEGFSQSVQKSQEPYMTNNKVRVVTAASLFDGHDAAINMIRRLLQQSGAEVIHLGHNRSVGEIVRAALQEDTQAICISSYQGGHNEFFRYMNDLLDECGASEIKIFGGGGGVIIPEEIEALQSYGITRIYSPDDGAKMGLQGMINDILERSDFSTIEGFSIQEFAFPKPSTPEFDYYLAKLLSKMEMNSSDENKNLLEDLEKFKLERKLPLPVIGITGTGGAGKSSFTDEIVLRFLNDFEEIRVGVLSLDPSRKRTGGALLGDRLRMNAIDDPRVFMRSFATRDSHLEVTQAIPESIKLLKMAGFDLIIVETPGIGQGNSAIVEYVDISVYVMTPEFGAPSQLEKIDMLDFADLVILNKFDKSGAQDAFRYVKKQYRRNHNISYSIPDTDLPVFGTISSHFMDTGVNAAYLYLLSLFGQKLDTEFGSSLPTTGDERTSDFQDSIIPPGRVRYLSEIAETVRNYKRMVEEQVKLVREVEHLEFTLEALGQDNHSNSEKIQMLIVEREQELVNETREALEHWGFINSSYHQEQLTYKVRGREFSVQLFNESLSGNQIPRVVVPNLVDRSSIIRYILLENVPGYFPYTAGVFPFKRTDEEPKRQFAGEGPPSRTNKRFHYLTQNDPAKRLSTAFDSVTLYGEDPDHRPDIFGKVGESGVSVATLEDVKTLYSGFDLCNPNTSVSMTINGPAPIMLAFFLNTAIDQQVEKFERQEGRKPTEEELEKLRVSTLQNVRGTVQADILKEDQAQNTCIFSTQFSIKMMGDIQEFFVREKIRNFYSVSISGYHIAEAGANPISQLAFTLANGFTYVEYYLSRGMDINDFGPSLSFFFSNGLDIEYTVIGRVARRIWAVAMRYLYNGNDRSQKLKYHIQTSGRSLHAQEIQFNDIRTTLQALLAFYDNCNSLHTNAYDEAITTPTEESVRRAMAIQLIINREFGWAKVENPHQGAYILEELTELVEEAVLTEFDRMTERGGVLGSMELGYQRAKIQDESLYYEHLKHSGELPIIGVNTFQPEVEPENKTSIALTRSTEEEKKERVAHVKEYQQKNSEKASQALVRLKKVAIEGGNIFEELMRTARVASIGQISSALYQVGGRYRRGM